MEQKAPNGRGISPPSMIRFGAFELDLRAAELRKNGHRIRLQEQPFQILVELLERPGEVVSREEIRQKLWPDNTVVEFDHSINAAVKRLRDVLQESPKSPQYIETLARRGYRLIVPVSREQEASPPGVAAPTAAPVPIEEGLTRVLDEPPEPRFIETVPASAYRFSSPVEAAEGAPGVSAAAPDPAADREARFATVPVAGNAAGRAGRIRWKWVLAACAAAAGLFLGGILYLSRPLPPPHVTEFTKITHDGRSKGLGGTDGTRLYFSYLSPASIAQVGVNGGEIVPLPMTVPGADSYMVDLSPDGSNALVRVYPDDRSLWVVPLLGGSPRRVGNLEGAFSPDGASVVYSTDKGEVFVVRNDGTGLRKLATVGPVPVSPFPASFKWSPDGRVIRFSRGGRLWEIGSDGSGLHPLLSGWHEQGVQCCGGWTPDGQFYVFSLQSRSTDSQIWALDERRGLFRQPPSPPVPLTTGPIVWGGPLSSRDGKKIFANGRTPRGELSRIDPRTRGLQPFLGGISAEFVSYSSDGKSVAYVSFPEGVLWKANQDGTNRVQLSQPPMLVVNPRWSPDSKQILFTDFRGKTLQIYVIPAEGGSARRLLPEEAAGNSDPNWSPDGTRVVYSWERVPTKELKLCILGHDPPGESKRSPDRLAFSPRAGLPMDGISPDWTGPPPTCRS